MKVLLAVLLFASVAQAQSISGLSLFASAAADLASTRYGMSRGAHEANPLIGSHLVVQSAFTFGEATGMFLATRHMSKKASFAIRVGYVASRAFISIHNVRTR